MVNELDQRTSSDHEELRKLPVSVTAESLGDVSGDRTGGIANLIAELEIARSRAVRSYLVHLVTKLVRKLPHHQFLKASSPHATAEQHVSCRLSSNPAAPQHPSTYAPKHLLKRERRICVEVGMCNDSLAELPKPCGRDHRRVVG